MHAVLVSGFAVTRSIHESEVVGVCNVHAMCMYVIIHMCLCCHVYMAEYVSKNYQMIIKWCLSNVH